MYARLFEHETRLVPPKLAKADSRSASTVKPLRRQKSQIYDANSAGNNLPDHCGSLYHNLRSRASATSSAYSKQTSRYTR